MDPNDAQINFSCSGEDRYLEIAIVRQTNERLTIVYEVLDKDDVLKAASCFQNVDPLGTDVLTDLRSDLEVLGCTGELIALTVQVLPHLMETATLLPATALTPQLA